MPKRLPLLPMATALACAALGCAPALDWREVRPADTGLVLHFPCKPSGQERRMRLAGKTVPLRLHACSAGGLTWGLAAAEMGDPTLLAAAMDALRASAAANIGADAADAMALQVAGATPHPASAQVRLAGKRPDGQAVHMQVGVFVRGTQVFQASVLGDKPGVDEVQAFFSSMRFVP